MLLKWLFEKKAEEQSNLSKTIAFMKVRFQHPDVKKQICASLAYLAFLGALGVGGLTCVWNFGQVYPEQESRLEKALIKTFKDNGKEIAENGCLGAIATGAIYLAGIGLITPVAAANRIREDELCGQNNITREGPQ